jgi:hypothetical protein
MFQFWLARWLSEKLNRKLKVSFHEPIQLNKDIYPNLGDFEVIPRLNIGTHNPSNGVYIGGNDYEQNTVNIDSIINENINLTRPIYIDFHNEDYSNIRSREQWVKQLYMRSHSKPLTCNNSLVLHLRLGDTASQYVTYI